MNGRVLSIDLVAERTPFAGLTRFLDDPAVTEVMVNGGGEVWIERAGRVAHAGRVSTSAVLAAIEHVLAPIGRRLDRLNPVVDARLPDGSRVCAVLPPIAVDGPALAIRRFSEHTIGLDQFAADPLHSPAPPLVDVLHGLVTERRNLVVSGATSSGKTTLLNALASYVPAHQRLVTLEDTAELRLHHGHVVRLETRDATAEGLGAVTMADLVRVALRLRPDRLIVGEVRGVEALQLLQAMNTGHDGSMATIHANSAADALGRIASLVLAAAPAWPPQVVRELIGAVIGVVVHVARTADGRRIVEHVIHVRPDGFAGGALFPAGQGVPA